MRDDITINDRALAIEDKLIPILQNVYDPEIELDVYNLGLLYSIDLDENGHCHIVMTFTDTACGCTDTLPPELAEKLKTIEEIKSVNIEIVWSPAWKITRISRYGRIALSIGPR